MKPYRIQEPRKIIWSNLSEYIYRFLDLQSLKEKAKRLGKTYESVRDEALHDAYNKLSTDEASYMNTENDILFIEHREAVKDVSEEWSQSICDNNITDIFKYLHRYGSDRHMVIGIDSHNNLVGKREVWCNGYIIVFRMLFRELKPGLTQDQYRRLTYKINTGTITSADLSRYTRAIGYKLGG